MTVTLEDKILSASEVRQQFFRLLDEVRSGKLLIIHQPKHADVTLVPRVFLTQLLSEMEELLSHLESLELALDEKTVKAIRRSEEDINAGRTVSLQKAAKVLEEQKRRGHR